MASLGGRKRLLILEEDEDGITDLTSMDTEDSSHLEEEEVSALCFLPPCLSLCHHNDIISVVLCMTSRYLQSLLRSKAIQTKMTVEEEEATVTSTVIARCVLCAAPFHILADDY